MRSLAIIENQHLFLLILTVSLTCVLHSPSWGQPSGRHQVNSPGSDAFQSGQLYAADGDSYLESGEIERATDAFLQAEEAYRTALSHNPALADAWERLGYVLYVMGRQEEAVELLETAMASYPDSLKIRRMMGINLYEIGDNIERAVQLLTTVDEAGSASADTLFILARHYYLSDQFNHAIPYFERYLAQKPDDIAGHNALANAYLNTGDYTGALLEYRAVLDLDTENINARIGVADTYFASGHLENAISIYRQMLAFQPDNIRLWMKLGKAHLAEFSYQEALAAFAQIITIREDLYQGHYFMGVAYIELARFEESLAALNRAMELNPAHAFTHYRHGIASMNLGHTEEAIESFQQAARLRPEEPWFIAALGDVFSETERYQEALTAHQLAQTLSPHEIAFLHAVARDYILLEELNLAVTLLEDSLGEYTDEPSHRALLAEALQKRAGEKMLLGDNTAAEADISRLQEIAPGSLFTATTTAVYWLNQNRLLDARNALSDVVLVDQASPLYRRISARIYLGEGRPGQALEAMGDIAHRPQETLSPEDASLLATAYAMSDEWELALILYNLAETGGLSQEAQLASSHFQLAMSLAQAGEWRESRTHLEYLKEDERVLLLPLDSQFWTTFLSALSSLKAGDGNAALSYLEQARLLEEAQLHAQASIHDLVESGLFEVLTAYAHSLNEAYQVTLEMLQDTSSAFRSTTRDLEAWTHNALGYRALRNDEPLEAISHFEAALELTPNDPSILNNLACALSQNGQGGEALSAFQALAEENSIDIAHYNYALLTEQVSAEQLSAYQSYLRYIGTGDSLALEEATLAVENKERVFGFAEGVPLE